MPNFMIRVIVASMLFVRLTLPCMAQSQVLQPTSQRDEGGGSSASSLVLHTYSRLVTLEVVVKDANGKHVTGLTPDDFRLFEQTPSRRKEKREQKIAAFREVSMADLMPHGSGPAAQIPSGIYTNVISSLKDPIPPTIILVDGLNTDVRYQAQIYVHMLKMLRRLPPEIPAAVFLLGRKLVMLQDFTTDPKLLQAALSKAITTDGQKLAQLDPRIAPDSVLNLLLKSQLPIPPEMLEVARAEDERDFSEQMDRRVGGIEEALLSIARYLSGYPGRKNLLWISTAFPISIMNPDLNQVGGRDYRKVVQKVTSALSDAKIAVYPINPAGVIAVPVYMSPMGGDLPPPGDSLYKPEVEREAQQGNTMQTMADATGGEVCTGDNDLADCVRKAVDDSSKFCEIAYYPNSKDWNGEYRKIILVTKTKGLYLEYRQGYLANIRGGKDDAWAKDELQRVACSGSLDATSIFLAAKSLHPDPNEAMKFYLMINPAALTFAPTDRSGEEVKLALGVCTFDETGKPLHYMSDSVDQKLTPDEYHSLLTGGLPYVVSIAGQMPAAVRLVVMDVASGRVGSVKVVNAAGPPAPMATK